ncbi:MAG: hypothetical protein HYW80_01215, partial [Parcubacteria group bacterium]|nr:hypothetical protein [Parcubacteria group bacterium]
WLLGIILAVAAILLYFSTRGLWSRTPSQTEARSQAPTASQEEQTAPVSPTGAELQKLLSANAGLLSKIDFSFDTLEKKAWIIIPGPRLKIDGADVAVRVWVNLGDGAAKVKFVLPKGEDLMALRGNVHGKLQVVDELYGAFFDLSKIKGLPYEKGGEKNSARFEGLFRGFLAETRAFEWLQEARETDLYARWRLVKDLSEKIKMRK